MRTVHPFVSFKDSARVLTDVQLSRQALEAMQLVMSLEGTLKVQAPYNSVQMWEDYKPALVLYGWIMCTEMLVRNLSTRGMRKFFGERFPKGDFELPHWLGDEEFHSTELAKLGLSPNAH